MTLEDETGVSNIIVWPKVYERFRRAVLGGRLLRVTGRLQREGQVIHVIATRIEDTSSELSRLGLPPGELAPGRSDEACPPRSRPAPGVNHPRQQAKALFPSRDFH